jgi:hypothetical protein
VIVSKIILIAAIVLAAVAADAGEVPRQSVIFLHPQPQPLVIFGR